MNLILGIWVPHKIRTVLILLKVSEEPSFENLGTCSISQERKIGWMSVFVGMKVPFIFEINVFLLKNVQVV